MARFRFHMWIAALCLLSLTACTDAEPPSKPVTAPPVTVPTSVEDTPAPPTEAELQAQARTLLQAQRAETGEVTLVKMGSGFPVALADSGLTSWNDMLYMHMDFWLDSGFLPEELPIRLRELNARHYEAAFTDHNYLEVEGYLVFPTGEALPRWCVDTEHGVVYDVWTKARPEKERIDFILLRSEAFAAEYHALLLEIKDAWEGYVEELQNSQYLIEGSVIERQEYRIKLRGIAARNDGTDTVTGKLWVELRPETDVLSVDEPGDWVSIRGYREDMPHITDRPEWSDYTCFESTGKSDQQVYLDGIQELYLSTVNYLLSYWPEEEQAAAPAGMVITPTYVDELGVVHGGYYSLTLPESWAELVEYEVTPGEAYTYSVSFYHKPDRDAGTGGHLFTLRLIPEWEDYSYLPSYERLGHLEVYRITGGDLVVVYPSDVQFDVGTAADYQAREAEISDVLASLTFSAEATFTK